MKLFDRVIRRQPGGGVGFHFTILLSWILIFACANKASKPEENSAQLASRTQQSELAPSFHSCPEDLNRQAERARELQKIVSEDQAARQIPADKIDWAQVSAADEIRLKRVGEIFAEGCFKTAADYAAAALVMQHGVMPDHYFQAYLWSKKAIELGDASQSSLMANAIDRYLVSIGQKQLFAGQMFTANLKDGGCACLQQTEKSFPDRLRIKLARRSLREQIEWLRASNKDRPSCAKVVYCEMKLKPAVKGQFPGIW